MILSVEDCLLLAGWNVRCGRVASVDFGLMVLPCLFLRSFVRPSTLHTLHLHCEAKFLPPKNCLRFGGKHKVQFGQVRRSSALGIHMSTNADRRPPTSCTMAGTQYWPISPQSAAAQAYHFPRIRYRRVVVGNVLMVLLEIEI
jgi:hypothetical protein